MSINTSPTYQELLELRIKELEHKLLEAANILHQCNQTIMAEECITLATKPNL